jgi:hypothetical protein
MLSIASELQKHHIKFILLYATDPVDQLFIARYLRTAYPGGRVIITVPDLLFTREEDALLRGVLGLSSYAMVPGLGDRLCESDSQSRDEKVQEQEGLSKAKRSPHVHLHADRLFSSSLTVGVYNAMLGLLALQDKKVPPSDFGENALPPEKQPLPAAPYAEYAGLPDHCSPSPLAWLTILGQDGFWPVAPLDADPLGPADANDTTLKPIPTGDLSAPDDPVGTPEIWYSAYCLCVLMMAIQAVFSWTGSTLSDSEAGAQFARNDDLPTAYIVAAGATLLLLAFVSLMCARSPFLSWRWDWPWTMFLSLPFFLFIGVTVWDLARLREQLTVAIVFLSFTGLISIYLLAFDLPPRSHIYWLPRVVHLASGVSPVVPFLLLLAGGYWWTWQSLRGVTLVDFRRPRLPKNSDLPPTAYRISETEAEALRHTAHPFSFEWQAYLPVALLIPFAATVVDVTHPVQTVEGFAFDVGYSVLLFLMISVFLGCLLKLVRTWFACRHILNGLDRLALRRAFGRMKNMSWHSMWNPGGSTLRETYKLMSRALDNLVRLQALLNDKPDIPPAKHEDPSTTPENPIGSTMTTRDQVQNVYFLMHPKDKKEESIDYRGIKEIAEQLAADVEKDAKSEAEREVARVRIKVGVAADERGSRAAQEAKKAVEKAEAAAMKAAARTAAEAKLRVDRFRDYLKTWERRPAEAERMLMFGIECLQTKMAQTAGYLMKYVAQPFWDAERSPIVSLLAESRESSGEARKGGELKQSDSKVPPESLPLVRVLAEEYIALTYVNFLVTVLLRMRTMIVCAIGLYVFLVLSVNAYPFEPHPALQTLSVVLIVLLGAAVGYVYTEMHRDAILSNLTSREPGELGWEFWLKLLAAAAIPVFSLLATQFPEINQLLFSWLQPALEAVK